jgi:hypothetical protein
MSHKHFAQPPGAPAGAPATAVRRTRSAHPHDHGRTAARNILCDDSSRRRCPKVQQHEILKLLFYTLDAASSAVLFWVLRSRKDAGLDRRKSRPMWGMNVITGANAE